MKLPFLEEVAVEVAQFTPEQWAEMSGHLSNWLTLNAYFQTQPASRKLMQLMVMELADEPRQAILERLHGRIKETRHKEERAQLEFPEEDDA